MVISGSNCFDMHELSISQNIVSIVTDSIAKYPGAKVNSVKVSVGVYSGIDPAALDFSFPLASEGTDVEGAELLIDIVPLTVVCGACGKGPLDSSSLCCPVCGSEEITVKTGRDLFVSSIDLSIPE